MASISEYTSVLFTVPNFVGGMARTLDLSGVYAPYSMKKTGYEADSKALLSDWLQVGQDMSLSIGRYENGQQEN
jgi:hypothetical protein